MTCSTRWPALAFALATAVLPLSPASAATPHGRATSHARRCGLAEQSALPMPTGEHCLGKTSLHLVDPNRPERFTADDRDHRELMVKIWYPRADHPRKERAAYVDPRTAAWMQSMVPVVPLDAFARIGPHATVDAPMREGERYPVILFSPGFGLVTEIFSAILEDLASHGYVVVGIDHPYFSGLTVFPDGREVAFRADAPLLFEVLVEDQRFVLDQLEALNSKGSGIFAGHLDLARAGAFGHSIGGAASVQTARADARVKAAIDIDGAVFGEIGAWQTPVMLILSEDHRFASDPTLEPAWMNLAPGGSYAVLKGAAHDDFTDTKYLLQAIAPDFPLPPELYGPIEPALALRMTSAWNLAFFDTHLPPGR